MAGLYPVGGPPVVLAHRGGGALALENSPTAFAQAARLGVRHMETDVRATEDGVAVVIHDATLERTTTGRGPVAGRRWEELTHLRLRNDDPIPSLAGLLAAHPDLIWNVDVKSDHAVLPFLAAVGRVGAWDRVCAASFSTARLRRLRQLAGARLATATTPNEVAALRLGVPGSKGPGHDGSTTAAAQVPPRWARITVTTQRFISRAHHAGIAVHAWTINDPAQMRELLNQGVDGLVTDRPDLAMSVIAALDRADHSPQGRPQSRQPGATR